MLASALIDAWTYEDLLLSAANARERIQLENRRRDALMLAKSWAFGRLVRHGIPTPWHAERRAS